MPKMASKPPEAMEEAWDRFLLPPSEGTDPVDTLTLDF